MITLLFVFVVGIWGLYENTQYVTHMQKEELAQLVQNPDYMTAVVIYERDGIASQALAGALEQVIEKFHNYVKVYAIDCTDDEQICPQNIKEELPVFEAHVPNGLNPYTGKPLINLRKYEGIIGNKEITAFFVNNIPFQGEFLSTDTEEYLNENLLNHVILFTNKDTAPVMFKGLSAKYKGRIEFWVAFYNQTEYTQKYNIDEFPSIVVKSGNEVVNYQGKNDFYEISGFLDGFVKDRQEPKQRKKTPKTSKPQENAETIPEIPIYNLDSTNFKTKLDEGKLAVIHFYKENQVAEWDDIKKNYNGVVMLGNFNCKSDANEEFARELGVKKFPTLRLFPINRKRKSLELTFANREELEEEISRELKGEIFTLNDKNINAFVTGAIEEQKLGVLYMTSENTNIQFRALASDPLFKDLIKSGYFKKTFDEAKKIFNLNKYPSIVAFSKSSEEGSFQVLEYTGSLENYAHMSYFIDKQAIPYLLKREAKIEIDEENADIPELSNKNIDKFCNKKGGICVIGFFEGKPVFFI